MCAARTRKPLPPPPGSKDSVINAPPREAHPFMSSPNTAIGTSSRDNDIPAPLLPPRSVNPSQPQPKIVFKTPDSGPRLPPRDGMSPHKSAQTKSPPVMPESDDDEEYELPSPKCTEPQIVHTEQTPSPQDEYDDFDFDVKSPPPRDPDVKSPPPRDPPRTNNTGPSTHIAKQSPKPVMPSSQTPRKLSQPSLPVSQPTPPPSQLKTAGILKSPTRTMSIPDEQETYEECVDISAPPPRTPQPVKSPIIHPVAKTPIPKNTPLPKTLTNNAAVTSKPAGEMRFGNTAGKVPSKPLPNLPREGSADLYEVMSTDAEQCEYNEPASDEEGGETYELPEDTFKPPPRDVLKSPHTAHPKRAAAESPHTALPKLPASESPQTALTKRAAADSPHTALTKWPAAETPTPSLPTRSGADKPASHDLPKSALSPKPNLYNPAEIHKVVLKPSPKSGSTSSEEQDFTSIRSNLRHVDRPSARGNEDSLDSPHKHSPLLPPTKGVKPAPLKKPLQTPDISHKPDVISKISPNKGIAGASGAAPLPNKGKSDDDAGVKIKGRLPSISRENEESSPPAVPMGSHPTQGDASVRKPLAAPRSPDKPLQGIFNDVKTCPAAASPDTLSNYPWYHGDITRDQTERMIRQHGGDGTFVVRKSSKPSLQQPYTMTILYKDNIFILKIRCREDKRFALGEVKIDEMAFSSVAALISYHQEHNVILIGQPGGKTLLLNYPTRKT